MHLSLVGEGGSLLVSPEKRVEEDVIDARSDEREVDVSGQVDEAEAVGEATHQFEAADPLEAKRGRSYELAPSRAV